MSSTPPSSPTVVPPTPSPQPAPAAPSNEFERFLVALPDGMRDECRSKLSGSGLSPDLPVFTVLADLFQGQPAPGEAEPVPDFLEEARLHAERSRQLLDAFEKIPVTLLAKIDEGVAPLLSALTVPVQQLQTTANHLQRNVEALPVLLLARRRAPPENRPEKWWERQQWRLRTWGRVLQILLSDHQAWLVTGIISLCVTIVLTITILSVGAHVLSRSYEQSYQKRLAHLEADSVENTIALNRLLTAGISLKVERASDDSAYFLVLQGAHKAAQPVNSPEGLAVEVWP
jgi:hypothetical protein